MACKDQHQLIEYFMANAWTTPKLRVSFQLSERYMAELLLKMVALIFGMEVIIRVGIRAFSFLNWIFIALFKISFERFVELRRVLYH